MPTAKPAERNRWAAAFDVSDSDIRAPALPSVLIRVPLRFLL